MTPHQKAREMAEAIINTWLMSTEVDTAALTPLLEEIERLKKGREHAINISEGIFCRYCGHNLINSNCDHSVMDYQPSDVEIGIIKPLQSQLTAAREEIERLKEGLHNQERVVEVCNEAYLDKIKPIRHLWDEFNQPPGVGMIVDKLQALQSKLTATEAKLVALEAALLKSREAMNVWTATYAPEFCDPEHVESSRNKINENGGTIAYIADIGQTISVALSTFQTAETKGGKDE